MPPSTTLNHLPNELLLLIFQDLDTSSLIAVSCLCKRINTIATAQILFPLDSPFSGLFKLSTSMLFGGSGLTFSSIPALRLAFSIKDHVDLLSCRFSLGECAKEMEQVTRLFKTERELHSVFLHFPAWPTLFRPPATYSPIECGAAISGLLRHLHSVKCHSLDINDVPQVEYAEGTKFDGPIINTLKNISISQAHFMLKEFFRDWTISTMNLSPLTKVSLVNVDVRTLLPSLFLPSLQKLVVRCPDLHLTDITSFLSRHPTINNLTLRVICDDASLPPGSLPELKSLSSSADCLSQLLSSLDSMLQLHSVICYGSANLFHITPPPPSTVQTLFQKVALHDTITTLDVPLSDLNTSEEWLSVTPRYEHLLTGITTLYVESSSTARKESTVRQRIIESIVLFPRLKTLTLFGWPQREKFARSIKAVYPSLHRITSGLTDIL